VSLPVVFKPAALAEIEAAYAWYELQASGLGAGFLRRVKLTELSISREPCSVVSTIGAIQRSGPMRLRERDRRMTAAPL